MLWCCAIGYGITLKVSKSKYKIRYNFMGSTIKVLNYRYFHTDSSTFFLNKKNVGKIKKPLKTRFYRKIKKKHL